MDAAPSDAERSAVDGFLGLPETGWEGGLERSERDLRIVRGGREARDQRHLLLPALHALQAGVGWISRGGLNYVSQRLSVPPADAYGVATFYAMFSVEERPANVVHVCDDLACRGAGGLALCEQLERDAAPAGADAGGWTWVRSPCLGMCEQAPAVFAQRAGRVEVALGEATRATVDAIVAPDSDVVCAGGVGAPQTADRRPGGSAAPPPGRRRRSRVDRRLPGARWLRSAPRAARDGSGGRDHRGDRCEAPGTRRRRVPDRGEVAGGRHAARPTPLRDLQRR